MRYVRTCERVRDPEASMRFYESLGFECRGRLSFETAYNGYNHMALVVDDLDALLEKLVPTRSSSPYSPGGRARDRPHLLRRRP